jgi:hypothetical protein
MTEAQWLACEDPGAMTIHVNDLGAAPRKFRLLSCAYCRRIWGLLTFPGSRELVELVERFADGRVGPGALALAHSEYADALQSALRSGAQVTHSTAANAAGAAAWTDDQEGTESAEGPWRVSDCAAAAAVDAEATDEGSASAIEAREYREMGRIVRDIFGDPFRPVTFSAEWRADTVLALARQMYDSRDFSAMPILADALQDEGCDSEDILAHCRVGGPHARGCWVVDLVLGRS